MGDAETSLGGIGSDFTATAWSVVIPGRGATPEQRRAQMETLARRYWKPIYQYMRSRWKLSNENAKDLTQQFFLWMMETDFLAKARPERGRFRGFVKTAVNHFVMGEHDAKMRLKRGGGRLTIPLDFVTDKEMEPLLPAADPEKLLDEQWRRTLIDEALARLEAHYRASNRDAHFRIFRDFYFAPLHDRDYGALAARHGVSPVDVSNWLARARARFRGMLEELVAESVESADDLREEFRDLFGKLP